MKIERIEMLTNDIIASVKSKKMHLICNATPEGRVCSQVVKGELGMNEMLLVQCCEKVNSLKEVGTLFSEYYVTLFPHCKGVDLDQAIMDVFEANEGYLQTEKMVFDFEGFEFISPELIEMIIMEKWKDKKLCKEIAIVSKK